MKGMAKLRLFYSGTMVLILTRFYLFYGLQFLTPLRPVALLWWVGGGGGGGGAYFAKKIDLSVFNLRLLYINKQYDVLISDMISKIVYECLIKSSEHFLLFLCGNKNIQLVLFGISVIPLSLYKRAFFFIERECQLWSQ